MPGNKTHKKYRIWPWFVWSLAAGLFFAEYVARVSTSVMVTPLMSAFHVGALAIGGLSAYFYYPYILMQIPVGSLVDRFGPHKLLTGAAVLCGVACILFASTDSLALAALARVLMGFTAAFAFVGALKLAVLWFDPRRLGLLAGITQGLGMLGAMVSEGLFVFMVGGIGWRGTMGVIAGFILLLAVFIGLWVRDKPPKGIALAKSPAQPTQKLWQGLMVVLRSPRSWCVALYAGLLYAPTAAFAELWGPSFLQRDYHFSPDLAGSMSGAIFLGLAIGCPLLGRLSDAWGRRKPLMLLSAVMSLLFFTLIVYSPLLPESLLVLLLVLYGVSNSGIALAYAAASELHCQSISGVSIAFTNMASVLLGGALLQPVIGQLLELNWGHEMLNGVPYYSLDNYQHAFYVLPVALLLAILVLIPLKDSKC